ncbi:DUF3592 domain-containing protein [Halovenus sp. HT40]|uniref:DUF3592 domain-containing protein n=1 Tax=Halovenus sp. HT40 TaxID=3126691 RepID=UPI00300F5783
MDGSVGGIPVTVTRTTAILLLVGFAFAGYGGYDYVQQQAAIEDAVAVEATITETDLEETGGRGVSYDVQIEYIYQYQGTEYTNDERFPGSISPTYDTRSKAESVLDRYDTNETVTAYVDPAAPEAAFLERRTTNGPFLFAGFGCLVVLLNILDAIGAREPGRNTGVRPVNDHEPMRYETLFGVERNRINRLSKRLIVGAVLTVVLSLLGTVVLLLGAENSSVQADLTDPIGLVLLAGFAAAVVLLGALVLYGIWSFTEYRRLRERIPEPRPPSPFTRPTRLVTILFTNDGLDQYGRRVKRTGFVFVLVIFCLATLVGLLGF